MDLLTGHFVGSKHHLKKFDPNSRVLSGFIPLQRNPKGLNSLFRLRRMFKNSNDEFNFKSLCGEEHNLIKEFEMIDKLHNLKGGIMVKRGDDPVLIDPGMNGDKLTKKFSRIHGNMSCEGMKDDGLVLRNTKEYELSQCLERPSHPNQFANYEGLSPTLNPTFKCHSEQLKTNQSKEPKQDDRKECPIQSESERKMFRNDKKENKSIVQERTNNKSKNKHNINIDQIKSAKGDKENEEIGDVLNGLPKSCIMEMFQEGTIIKKEVEDIGGKLKNEEEGFGVATEPMKYFESQNDKTLPSDIKSENKSLLNFDSFYSDAPSYLTSERTGSRTTMQFVREYFNAHVANDEFGENKTYLSEENLSANKNENNKMDLLKVQEPKGVKNNYLKEANLGIFVSESNLEYDFNKLATNESMHTTEQDNIDHIKTTKQNSNMELLKIHLYNSKPDTSTPQLSSSSSSSSITSYFNQSQENLASTSFEPAISQNAWLVRKPALLRSTSLKCPRRGAKKKVRFADTYGLDLVSVRKIVSGENISDIMSDICERFPATDICERFPAIDSDIEQPTKLPAKLKRMLSEFNQPGNREDFLDKVYTQQVALESCLAEEKSFSVSGCIRVHNTAFEKEVGIRYSIDNWLSFVETKAAYVYGSNDGYTDRFSFTVQLPPYFDVGNELEFAIFLKLPHDAQFWDNNYGYNYRMICRNFY